MEVFALIFQLLTSIRVLLLPVNALEIGFHLDSLRVLADCAGMLREPMKKALYS
jgi:hypothetical protein